MDRLKMAKLLLASGADVNGADESGHTPLREAVLETNDYDLARLLLRHGASLYIEGHGVEDFIMEHIERFCSPKMVRLLKMECQAAFESEISSVRRTGRQVIIWY